MVLYVRLTYAPESSLVIVKHYLHSYGLRVLISKIYTSEFVSTTQPLLQHNSSSIIPLWIMTLFTNYSSSEHMTAVEEGEGRVYSLYTYQTQVVKYLKTKTASYVIITTLSD